jgi:hypothetical protein
MPLSKQRNKHIRHVLVEAAKLAPRQSAELALIHQKAMEKCNRNRATANVRTTKPGIMHRALSRARLGIPVLHLDTRLTWTSAIRNFHAPVPHSPVVVLRLIFLPKMAFKEFPRLRPPIP